MQIFAVFFTFTSALILTAVRCEDVVLSDFTDEPNVAANAITNTNSIKNLISVDTCVDICIGSDATTKPPDQNDMNQRCCEKGCRLFNIISLSQDENDNNKTLHECYKACDESYSFQADTSKPSCYFGCKSIFSKQDSDFAIAGMFLLLNGNEFSKDNYKKLELSALINIEEVDSELIIDPSVLQQLSQEEINYKIPLSSVRTMPIQTAILKQSKSGWLDCASYNSGIPKWVLIVMVIMAVIAVIWLSITADLKHSEKVKNVEEGSTPDENDEKKLFIDNEAEIAFSLPPKYDNETQQV